MCARTWQNRPPDLEYFRVAGGLNNGVMLRFPPGSSVTVRVRPHNVLGVEYEVEVAEWKKRVAAIFLLRFGRHRTLDDGFRGISAHAAALSPGIVGRSVQAPKSVRVILFPVR